MKTLRPIRIDGYSAFIPLTKGYEAVVDAADVPLVGQYNWHAHGNRHWVYAYRNVKRGNKVTKIMLHRIIMRAPDGMMVDHADGDGLNNRRSNLRLATNSENQRNRRPCPASSSNLKGVTWHAGVSKWQAQIKLNGRSKYLGLFATQEAAHAAYSQAASELFGDFARTSA